MDKSLTIKDQMKLKDFNQDSFDPMAIDASDLKSLYQSIPKDGNVDLYIAEKLAMQYLRAADRCSEILATLTLWEQTAKDTKKQTFSLAFLNAKNNGKKVTDTTAKHMAECESDYLESCRKAREAEVVRRRFEDMQSNFIKGHYLMKQRIRGEQDLKQISNYGEGNWTE